MSTLFQPTALVGSIAIALGFSTSAFATDSQDQQAVNTTLETLVVTATRSEEKIGDIPARINIIEPHILEQSPIAELPHLLMSDASINMAQYGGLGQPASIYMRGTNDTQTLVLRDGIRLNTGSLGAASLSFIDTTDIKQIEILKGPASVLYGTDAIGGIIHLVTQTPKTNTAFVTNEIGEHSTYKSILGADISENGFYAQIRGQKLESDGTQVTDYTHSNVKTGEYEQKGMSTKLGIDKLRYAASIDYSQNKGSSTYIDTINDANWKLIGLKNISQDFKNEVINLKGRVNFSDTISLNGRLSQFTDKVLQKDVPDYVENTTKEAELYGKWQFTTAQNILIGSTHKNLKSDILSVDEDYPADYAKDVNSTGYFIQHQYNTEKLNTQIGIRIEDHETFGNHTVGQVAARYHLSPITSIYSNIGTAFRAPTNNDLYAIGWGANPNLKPEESKSYEIGLDQQLTNHLQLGISVYRNEVDNLITWITDPITYKGQLFNHNKATFTGGEVNLNWTKDDLFTNFSYAYVQPKNEETEKDLANRSRQSLTLIAGLKNDLYGISASLSAKATPKNSKVKGYATLDVNAFCNINPNVKVFINIQNIGDVKYKTISLADDYYYINGGRLASAGVTFRY